MRDLGLTCIVRDVRFVVADNKANRAKAQRLLEAFGVMWMNEFPAFAQPNVHAQPIVVLPFATSIKE